MPRTGIEPARPEGHEILSLACLPVPTPRRSTFILTNWFGGMDSRQTLVFAFSVLFVHGSNCGNQAGTANQNGSHQPRHFVRGHGFEPR